MRNEPPAFSLDSGAQSASDLEVAAAGALPAATVSQTESTPNHDDGAACGDSVDDRIVPAPPQDALKPKRAARGRGHGKTTSEDGRVLTALHIGVFGSRVAVSLEQV